MIQKVLKGKFKDLNEDGQDLNLPVADERETGIEEVLEILRRRKVALLFTMIIIFSTSVVVAWSLPELYRSTATILIEQQEIPTDLVRSTVTSYASERIQVITRRVLTTSNLQRIIEKFNLYPELRKVAPIDVVAARVRDHFEVEQLGTGRGRYQATIAFNVSYDSRSPAEAQAVATELSSLYLEENLKTRSESAAGTTAFLGAEAERLGSELTDLEAKIASFKEEHMGRLPEQSKLILDLMARAEVGLQNIERQLRSLEERKLYLETAMAQLKASSSGETSESRDQVQALRARLTGMLAVYTPDHPDVTRLRNEILALKEQQGEGQARLTTLQIELDERRAELAQALERDSPQHAHVKDLQRQVANLEAALEGAQGGESTSTTDVLAGPGYAELQLRYRTTDNEIAALRSERSQLQAKLAAYEAQINEIPQVERKYSLLVRDRDDLTARYHNIKSKLSGARIAEKLENARKGERFSLIEPARRPTKPFKPNRKKILALGLIGSVGAGVGAAIVSELMHKAVYGARGVTTLLGVPPLALVPYIESPRDRRRRLLKWVLIGFVILVILGVSAAFAHFWIRPLEDIWTTLVAQINIIWMALIQRSEVISEALRGLPK